MLLDGRLIYISRSRAQTRLPFIPIHLFPVFSLYPNNTAAQIWRHISLVYSGHFEADSIFREALRYLGNHGDGSAIFGFGQCFDDLRQARRLVPIREQSTHEMRVVFSFLFFFFFFLPFARDSSRHLIILESGSETGFLHHGLASWRFEICYEGQVGRRSCFPRYV
jgi:hypothetical protein